MENDHTYSDEQKQLYQDRLDDLNTGKQGRLEILSQKKDGPTQFRGPDKPLESFLMKMHL